MLALAGFAAERFRPPAVPLIAHDPYFSIWSFADKLTDVPTTHWTGKPQPINGTITIDDEAPLRFMGVEPKSAAAMEQRSVDVYPTRTVYVFANDKIELTLMFLTPALPDDIDLLSRPLTTLHFTVDSLDFKAHRVTINLTVDPMLAVNTPEQEVVTETVEVDGLSVLRVGSSAQNVLGKRGDDIRIDWGYCYLAGIPDEKMKLRFVPRSETVSATAKDAPLLAAELKLDVLQDGRISRSINAVMLAYDDIKSIRYFGKQLPPYWKRDGASITDILKQGYQNFGEIMGRCKTFDEELIADLTKLGGEKYARLCSLVYRQVWAANKIIAAPDGRPYMLSKENHSNGCIGTIDVLYPHSPFLLLFSPALLKGSLVPVLNYAESESWPYDYAPHDIGQYPFATGQVYGMGGGDGNRMPVEESGNMLIIIAALAEIEGNADLAGAYWELLTVWADYLVREGYDPANQLCSADMFGHLAHVTNLSLKAIIGIGGYAKLCERLGKMDEAAKYRRVAEEYAAKWLEQAQDDGRTRLAFDQPGTWSMKHNLIWDKIIKTNLFPASLAEQEIAWYKKVQNRYGLPVDSRTDNSLIDWAVWSMTPAKNPADFEALFNPIYDYVNETPTRVPLSDWFFTTDAKKRGFQARSVVGGVYIKMLTDEAVWKKHTGRAEKVDGFPSRYPVRMAIKEIVPTSMSQQVDWKFTLDAPPENWFRDDFDDSAWKTGKSGFGNGGLPGNPPIGTPWTTNDIWLRREFELDAQPVGELVLYVYYDESPEIWINGVFAAKADGYSTSYVPLDITSEAAATLKPGKNRFAVKASQTWGGQYIDLGLAQEVTLTDAELKE